jgi:hypothetical protein
MRAPSANRFRAGTLESVFDRLGLTDHNMQDEQRRAYSVGPFVKPQIGHRVEQDRASEHDQRIGEDEIFRPSGRDGRRAYRCRPHSGAVLAAGTVSAKAR